MSSFELDGSTGTYKVEVQPPVLPPLTNEVKQEAGNKWDGDKLRYDLEPSHARAAVVGVLTYGAGKYGDRNWENGISYSRLYAAAQRHLADWKMKEDLDAESGLTHLAHAICDLMMLFEMQSLHPEKDDR